MTPAEIYRYSARGEIDKAVRAMQERIVEELRAERRAGKRWGLFTQAPDGREEYRERLSRTQAWQEAWSVTAEFYRNEYHRIESEVVARWGIDA